jgi:hypothetical protein
MSSVPTQSARWKLSREDWATIGTLYEHFTIESTLFAEFKIVKTATLLCKAQVWGKW